MAARARRRRPPPRNRRPARDRRPRDRDGGGGSDLLRRILVAIPAVAYALFIIAAGGWVFAVGILLLGLICLHELFRMYDGLGPVRLAGFAAVAGLAVGAQAGGTRQVLLALVAFIPVLFLLGLAVARRPGEPTLTEGMALTTLGVVWVGMAVAHAVLLRQSPHGDAIIIDILVGTFIGDTGAYLGGRSFGTRRLAPRISPNKTVEGLICGFVAAVIATWAAGLYQDWLTHGQALILGAAVGLAAPLGDLFESQVKRDAGRKDAGTLFGAHGGALDRLDAAFFTLVAGYYITLMATAISTACFIAPSAAHRLRFHQRDRGWLIETSNALAIAGLVFLAIAITGAVALITNVLFNGPVVWIYSIALAVFIAGLWFARPLLRGDESSGP